MADEQTPQTVAPNGQRDRAGRFVPGHRGGRVSPNKITSDLKAMIEGALEDAGGRAYLARQAEENPTAFMVLVGKILPREIKAEVAATHVIQRLSPEQLAGIVEAVTGAKR